MVDADVPIVIPWSDIYFISVEEEQITDEELRRRHRSSAMLWFELYGIIVGIAIAAVFLLRWFY